MDSFNKLADLFKQFPGIGARQSKRFVYFLLSRDPEFIKEFVRLAGTLKKDTVVCEQCFRFFQRKNGRNLCSVCADQNRSDSELLVVAKDTDLDSVEKSGTYSGRYFVLGGTISLLESKSSKRVRVKELLTHVSGLLKKGVLTEIILALSANPDGEHTSDELRKALTPLLPATQKVKISVLGRGLSTGSELEYADKETIKSALRNRVS